MVGVAADASDCEKVTLLIWFANMGLFTGYTEIFHFCQITPSSLRGAPTSQMGMTTVWRPRVRIAVPNIDDAEDEVEVPEEVNKGREAEESPSNKGAMRARGEEPLGVQGVQRLSARSSALSMQGVRWACNMRARSSAL